jgi:hypothetical protein
MHSLLVVVLNYKKYSVADIHSLIRLLVDVKGNINLKKREILLITVYNQEWLTIDHQEINLPLNIKYSTDNSLP